MSASRLGDAVAVMVLAVALGACGGGGSSGTPPPAGTSPPSSLCYPNPPTYTVNSPIPALSPSVMGTVTSYTVTPALPAGLTLDASTGVISGTPTQPSAQASYSITASNAAGSTKSAVAITVDAGFAYASSYYSFTKGVTSRTIAPAVAGAPGSSWSVTPALPAGLTLNGTDGAISGTPGAASAAAQYVVTAKNPGGQSSVTLTVAVAAGPLFDLGHVARVLSVRLVGARLLTQDASAHWVLWDYTTDKNLANGTTSTFPNTYIPYPVDLEGSTVVVQSSGGLEVLSATDGTVQAQIAATPSWWLLATDGSYIVTGSTTGLTVYSRAGGVVLTHPGNYANALTFAGPAHLQVALGAAGASVIETIAVPNGTTSVGPAFLGTFQSWFLDGGNFLTANGTTVWVYPANYSSPNDFQGPVALPTVTGLGGTGNWFWTFTTARPSLALYQVGVTGSNPPPNYTQSPPVNSNSFGAIVATPTTLGFLTQGMNGPGTLIVSDLSNSSTVSATSYTAPIDLLTAYGASSSSAWVVGNTNGVLYDGASAGIKPRYLDYGVGTAVAASASEFAVATASNRILYFNATDNALEGTISQAASNVQLSTDGTVLAAATPGVINVYALPGGTQTVSFPFTSPESVFNMSLSGSGTVLGEVISNAGCGGQAIAVETSATLWCVPPTSPLGSILLSADGTAVAAAPAYSQDYTQNGGNYSTNIYTNYTLATAVPGIVQGWLSPTTVLVASYAYTGPSPADQWDQYVSSSLYNVSGNPVSSLNLPDTGPVQTLSATLIYSLLLNAMYSLAPEATATATWSSGSPFSGPTGAYSFGSPIGQAGAATGSQVVFLSGNLVLAEPYK